MSGRAPGVPGPSEPGPRPSICAGGETLGFDCNVLTSDMPQDAHHIADGRHAAGASCTDPVIRDHVCIRVSFSYQFAAANLCAFCAGIVFSKPDTPASIKWSTLLSTCMGMPLVKKTVGPLDTQVP